MFGWKGDSLQRAMDSNCMFNACENGNPLRSQGVQEMNACTVPRMIEEPTEGCKYSLRVSRIGRGFRADEFLSQGSRVCLAKDPRPWHKKSEQTGSVSTGLLCVVSDSTKLPETCVLVLVCIARRRDDS